MKNDEIYNAAFFILDKFEWKKPASITEEDNKKAYDTLQVALNLFEKINIESCCNNRINYGIYYRLPNVERELEQKCWHNACHELRDFLQLEFRIEKRMLTDTVYVLKKYLKGEAPAAEEIVKYILSLSRDVAEVKRKKPTYDRAKLILQWIEKYHGNIALITSICAAIDGFLLGLNVTVIRLALLAWIAAFIGFSVLLCIIIVLIVNVAAKRFVRKYEQEYSNRCGIMSHLLNFICGGILMEKHKKYYKSVREKIIIFARWHTRWAVWFFAGYCLLFAFYLRKTPFSFVFYVIALLWYVMCYVFVLIAFEPLKEE